MLAGLVASAASCGVVPLWVHAITSSVSAIAAKLISKLLIRQGIDDVTSVVPVHLVGGVISVVSVGFFAETKRIRMLPMAPSDEASQISTGIVFGGNGSQLGLQLLWLLFILAWTITITVPLCLTLRSLGHLRNDTRSTLTGAFLLLTMQRVRLLAHRNRSALYSHGAGMCGKKHDTRSSVNFNSLCCRDDSTARTAGSDGAHTRWL